MPGNSFLFSSGGGIGASAFVLFAGKLLLSPKGKVEGVWPGKTGGEGGGGGGGSEGNNDSIGFPLYKKFDICSRK